MRVLLSSNMAPAALTPAHEFFAVAGRADTANAAFLATLTADGPLLIRDEHILARMLPNLPVHSAGNKRFDFRRVFFCLLSRVRFFDGSTPLLPRPIWLARFVRSLCDAGMPTAAVADEVALRDLVAEHTLLLPDAQRTIDLADAPLARYYWMLH